jgi:hypothetical protein
VSSLPVLKEGNFPRVLGLGGLASKRFLRGKQMSKIWFGEKKGKDQERNEPIFLQRLWEIWEYSNPNQAADRTGGNQAILREI